ncbi:MAG: universal stress protein [Bacteroidota bacterium]
MKYVLVPTDFSDCATYASDIAIEIAGKTGACVHFFTRLHIHPLWKALPPDQQKEYPESLGKIEAANKAFDQLKDRYPLAGFPIKTSFEGGDILTNVYKIHQFEEIPLIVMGSSGSSGLEEMLFGSNAQKIVKYVPCPIMVVKHPVEGKHKEFKHIIFASDFQDSAIEPFKKLLDFAVSFGAHIHLLHVDMSAPGSPPNKYYLNRMKKFEEICYKLPCTLHERGDVGIEEGIQHFAQDIQADMVALAHYGKSSWQRLLQGSIAESLVNHLEIPVMVLNTRENLTTRK